MSEKIQVPDVGSSDPVDVIEVSVKKGDSVEAEDTIVVLESDKASVEVPCPKAGTVLELLVKAGDRVKEGDPLLELDTEAGADDHPRRPVRRHLQAFFEESAANVTGSIGEKTGFPLLGRVMEEPLIEVGEIRGRHDGPSARFSDFDFGRIVKRGSGLGICSFGHLGHVGLFRSRNAERPR